MMKKFDTVSIDKNMAETQDKEMRELTVAEIRQVAGGVGVQWGHTHNSAWVKPFLGKRPGHG